MPNTGRYVLCPYYTGDRNDSISCEDTFRTFLTSKNKEVWMSVYCEKAWNGCPWAEELNRIYSKMDKGDDSAMGEHEIKALKKELRYNAVLLGKAKKENKQLKERVDRLTKIGKEDHRKATLYREELENYKRSESEQRLSKLNIIIGLYKDVMCYLMAHTDGLSVAEKDVQAWAEANKDKCYSVLRYPDENGKIFWHLVEGRDDEDTEHTDLQDDVEEGQEVRQQEGRN